LRCTPSETYGAESIVNAEPAIRQLLQLDFQPKVEATIQRNFRQAMNQMLKTQVLPFAESYSLNILQQYDQARAHLQRTLEEEAKLKIAQNEQDLGAVEEKIKVYNEAIAGINDCLESFNLYDKRLPLVSDGVPMPSPTIEPEISTEVSDSDPTL